MSNSVEPKKQIDDKKKPVEPGQEKKPSVKKPKRTESDFKRKYFDYYDDIKISDRQDW